MLPCSPIWSGPRKGRSVPHNESWGQKLKIECKSRKELAKWIVEALGDHDAVIIKQDRGETYVLQRINTFADMCQ
jgi:hypothetical protein